MFKNIARFGNTGDYLPLFNGVLFTDLAVIALLNAGSINSRVLRKWYTDYNLSAVIADVLIILIGLIIVRAVYYHVFAEFSIWKFILLAVAVQFTHDMLFYFMFYFDQLCKSEPNTRILLKHFWFAQNTLPESFNFN